MSDTTFPTELGLGTVSNEYNTQQLSSNDRRAAMAQTTVSRQTGVCAANHLRSEKSKFILAAWASKHPPRKAAGIIRREQIPGLHSC